MRLRAPKSKGLTADDAEAIGAEALRFLASDGLRISNFLRDTGLEPQQLAALAGSRDFLGAVLDFVVRDESLLMVFAAEAGHRPEIVVEAHRLLQGPEPEVSV